jgi:tRNA threonylcarbamoyladenosine biosynthesis protein TsaB
MSKNPAAASAAAQPELIVALDAATPIVSVALATAQGHLLALLRGESRRPASQGLLAHLDHLMTSEGYDPARVRAVAVTLGPGMFTGMRVGLSVAKTLAHGWGVPLYGYSTLEVTAARWPVAGDAVCVLLDARRGEIYSGIYRVRENGRPEVLRADRVEAFETLLEAVAGMDLPAIAFSGNGLALHQTALAERLGSRARFVPAPWDGPGADALALAAARDLAAGVPGLDPLAAAPLYLRASDAERRHSIIL